MRTASLMMVLLLGTALVAEEPKAGSKKAGDDKESTQVVNKPVVGSEQADQTKKDDATSEGQKKDGETKEGDGAEQVKPLHQHPTLLKMLARNNQLRQARGLRPHRINPALTKAAQDHAAYMAKTRVFSHYANGNPTGRATRHGFGAGVLENIGYGYGNVDNAFSGWFNSGGHRASMMSNTSDAGFGYAQSPDGTPYWVAVYGTAPKGQEPEDMEIELVSGDEPVKESTGKKDDNAKGQDDEAAKDGGKVKKDPAVVPAAPK